MASSGDSASIAALVAAVTAMRGEAQTSETNIRADLRKTAEAMTAMQTAMNTFDTTTKNLQATIDQNAKDNDDKLNQLSENIKAWANAQFGKPAGSSGSAGPWRSNDTPMPAAGEHDAKRPRSAGPFERRGTRTGPAPTSNYEQPTHCVWIGGFPRKLVAVVLEKAAKAICLAYLTSGTDVKVLARSMQPGFKLVFDDGNDMKDFLLAFRARPHVWADPTDILVAKTLHAKVDRSAADRVRISLMTLFWGLINPLLIAADCWQSDRNRLRSQGTSGILWIDNTANNDGREILSVRFGSADPTFEWNLDQTAKYNIPAAKLDDINMQALAEWKAKHAVE
jgi:hypothetical protein